MLSSLLFNYCEIVHNIVLSRTTIKDKDLITVRTLVSVTINLLQNNDKTRESRAIATKSRDFAVTFM